MSGPCGMKKSSGQSFDDDGCTWKVIRVKRREEGDRDGGADVQETKRPLLSCFDTAE